MQRRTFLITSAAASALTALPALAQDGEKLKVGFIYVGPIGDGGWSYQHDQGRLAIEEKYGDKIETSYIESVPEGADARTSSNRAEEGALKDTPRSAEPHRPANPRGQLDVVA